MPVRIFGLFAFLIVALYVFFDSRKKGFSQFSSFLWMIFTLFFPVLAMPLYFLFRSKRLFPSKTYSNAVSQNQSKLCSKCGFEAANSKQKCPKCGNSLTVS